MSNSLTSVTSEIPWAVEGTSLSIFTKMPNPSIYKSVVLSKIIQSARIPAMKRPRGWNAPDEYREKPVMCGENPSMSSAKITDIEHNTEEIPCISPKFTLDECRQHNLYALYRKMESMKTSIGDTDASNIPMSTDDTMTIQKLSVSEELTAKFLYSSKSRISPSMREVLLDWLVSSDIITCYNQRVNSHCCHPIYLSFIYLSVT